MQLGGGILERCILEGGSLEGGSLEGGNLEGGSFVGGSLEGGSLVGGNIERCSFRRALMLRELRIQALIAAISPPSAEPGPARAVGLLFSGAVPGSMPQIGTLIKCCGAADFKSIPFLLSAWPAGLKSEDY